MNRNRFICVLIASFTILLLAACSAKPDNGNIITHTTTTTVTMSRIEDEAAAEFGKIAPDIELGTYVPDIQKDRLDELYEMYPDNPAVSTYYNVQTAIFWKSKLDGMLPDDENYALFQEYYMEALAAIDITLDIEHIDSIKTYIENYIGMDEYTKVHKELSDSIRSATELSEAEKVSILIEVFEISETFGDSITDEITEQIWHEICEKYQITASDLTGMMLDEALMQKVYAELE